MLNEPCENMYQYHVWANKALLERIKELPNDVMHKEVHSSYPTIVQTFSHICAVDVMWLQVLKGIDMQEALEGSMAYAERAHLYSADEFAASYEELASQFEEWMNSQTDLEQK